MKSKTRYSVDTGSPGAPIRAVVRIGYRGLPGSLRTASDWQGACEAGRKGRDTTKEYLEEE